MDILLFMTIIPDADLHGPAFLFENTKTHVFFCVSLCRELAFQGGKGLI